MAAAAVAAQNLGFDGTVRCFITSPPSIDYIILVLHPCEFVRMSNYFVSPVGSLGGRPHRPRLAHHRGGFYLQKNIEKLQVTVEGPVGPAGNKFSVNTVQNLKINIESLSRKNFF